MMVWPGGGGGPVCHSSEVRKWNVMSNGNLMMMGIQLIDMCISFQLKASHFLNVRFKTERKTNF